MLLAALFSAVMMLSYSSSSSSSPKHAMLGCLDSRPCIFPMDHLWVQGHDGDDHFEKVLTYEIPSIVIL